MPTSDLAYVIVAFGVALEGETALVAAGAIAHRGDLSLPLVMLSAFIGSVAADQGWFHFGRRAGPPFLARHPRVRERAEAVDRWIERWDTALVLGFRFMYGFRTATPLMLGVSAYPARRFAVLNTVGGAVWAVTFGALGYGLGATFVATLRRFGRLGELAFVAVVLTLVFLSIGRMLRRRISSGREQRTERLDAE